MAELRLAPAARSDLRDIRVYSKRQFGVVQTLKYLSEINHAFERLRAQPFIGMPEADLGDGFRSYRCQSHRMYYRVTPNRIEIVRILHHAQDRAQVGSS